MLFFSSLILAMASMANGAAPKLVVENCDAGEVYAFNMAECQIALINEGEVPIRVFSIRPDKPGDALDKDETTVAPHARTYLRARINAGNASGGNAHPFRFETDEPGAEHRVMSAFAFVLGMLDDVAPKIDFQVVDTTAERVDVAVEISSHDVADFRVTSIIEKPDWLDARIEAQSNRVVARVRKDATWGIHADYIKLRTNSTRQPQVWVTAKADIHGDVIPASNPFEMGLMRLGSGHEFEISLIAPSGKDFRVGKIEATNIAADVRAAPCKPAKAGCQLLVVTISDRQAAGTIQGHVLVDFPDLHQKLHVALFGLLVSKDVHVKTIDPNKVEPVPAGSAGASTDVSSQDLGKSIRHAIDSADEQLPAGEGPMLQWTIAKGMAIHGFQIFRSESENGQFLLLNEHTIPSTALTQDSVRYRYRDNSAKSGRTYWYYIGLVYNDGHRQQLTGPQKVLAK